MPQRTASIEKLIARARAVELISFDCRLANPDGSVVFQQDGVQAPANWSQDAVNILTQKYMRRVGVPTATTSVTERDLPAWLSRSVPAEGSHLVGETSARQVFHRMAGAWTYWGYKYGYFDEPGAKTFYDCMVAMLTLQMMAPNSPQWFNTGLHWAYGIEGSAQGHWYTDPYDNCQYPATSAYERPQPHACFIQSIEDDLVNPGGIMDLLTREARIFKYGSGSGSNFSQLRGKNERLSGGGKSSGLLSFLRIGDSAAGAIKSGGTTRRAAKMVVVDADHPDVEEFIRWKADEEQKVLDLVRGNPTRYLDTEGNIPWEGEAYRTVSGQNANNSVSVTDDFMNRAMSGDLWDLTARTDGHMLKQVNAHDLLRQIAEAAWLCGDPGLHYRTTINKWNTCKNDGDIEASNPCSEYVFLNETACNLASHNLVAYMTEDGGIDTELFQVTVSYTVTMLDICNSMAALPSQSLAKGTSDYRSIGLGFANLGGLLMRLGLPYDSVDGRAVCSGLSALMMGEAMCTSASLASKLGAFPRFEANKFSVQQVLKLHSGAAYQFQHVETGFKLVKDLQSAVGALWSNVELVVTRHGLRNAQLTLLAPTGTIAFVMDCDTTGIEPDFALAKSKTLAGGGRMTIVNKALRPAMRRLGYSAAEIEDFERAIQAGIKWAGFKNTRDASVFHCAGDISPQGHMKMMAAAQPFLSGAISKTINLPNDASVEDIFNLYVEGWHLGLKALAVYRDGCKQSQPLKAITDSSQRSEAEVKPERRVKLPPRRTGYTQRMVMDGQTIYLRTGEYPDGSLGEIFIDMYKEGASFRSLLSCFSVIFSQGLQHGIPLEAFVRAMRNTQFEPMGLVRDHDSVHVASSVLDLVAQDLEASYLSSKEGPTEPSSSRGTYSGRTCRDCGSHRVRRTGSCFTCEACGANTGCG
jgi:ribonucleoside-diphosphate reductase alpha chain